MPGLELHTLIFGGVVLAAAIGIVLSQRQRSRRENPPANAGLLAPERSLEPPVGQTPGMVGALRQGEVDARDLRLTLVDLAARGYLRLTPLVDEHGHSYDWVIRRTARPVDASLHRFEKVLVTLPFEAGEGDDTPRTSITLSGMSALASRPLRAAESALVEYLRTEGCLTVDARQRHSTWGWVGALTLVAGLLVTVVMLIDWLATADFRGVIGGLCVVGAGILLASRGRRHPAHTDAGGAARKRLETFGENLTGLQAEDLLPEQTAELFSQLLPWAIALNDHEGLARTVDHELRRAANWGRHIDLGLPWLQADQNEGAATARELADRVAELVNQRLWGRGARRRSASR